MSKTKSSGTTYVCDSLLGQSHIYEGQGDLIGELATQKPFPITMAGTTQNSSRAVFSQVKAVPPEVPCQKRSSLGGREFIPPDEQADGEVGQKRVRIETGRWRHLLGKSKSSKWPALLGEKELT